MESWTLVGSFLEVKSFNLACVFLTYFFIEDLLDKVKIWASVVSVTSEFRDMLGKF